MSDTAAPARIAVRKTYKLYIGGAFPRSESGRSYVVTDHKGGFLANAALASRKDARDEFAAERLARGRDRAVHVCRIGIRNRRDFAPGRRIDDRNALAGFRLHPLAADEQAGRALQELCDGRRRIWLRGNPGLRCGG